MAEVTAVLVKELREKTGAGMMDCKRALDDSAGDIEAAVDWLRKKGLSAAAKKAGRVAAEGLIGVATRGPVGAVVEVNSETDFVARNQAFQSFVRSVSELALDGDGELEVAEGSRLPGNGSDRRGGADTSDLDNRRKSGAAPRQAPFDRAGRRFLLCPQRARARASARSACSSPSPRPLPTDQLAGLGKQLAMHIAAANPLYLDIASVPQAALDRERDVLREQARATGKPNSVVDRMVEGRLRKFYEEFVLLEQIFVVDQETKISKVVEQASKTAGAPISVESFARFALGEGIERQRTDFAAEVAAQLKN